MKPGKNNYSSQLPEKGHGELLAENRQQIRDAIRAKINWWCQEHGQVPSTTG
jgi:hypothetical protein